MTEDTNWRSENSNKSETYYFAKTSGDRTFITWIYNRLQNVYDENPCIDYMRTLKEFAEAGTVIDKILLRQAKKEYGL